MRKRILRWVSGRLSGFEIAVVNEQGEVQNVIWADHEDIKHFEHMQRLDEQNKQLERIAEALEVLTQDPRYGVNR